MSRLSQHSAREVGLLVTLALASWAAAQTSRSAAPADGFTLLHFSDIHVGPQLAGAKHGPVQGEATLKWLVDEVRRPQAAFADEPPLPPPSVALATGDLTEYGVIDETWARFEEAFAGLPCKLYVVPGNHDNTWVAMYQVMRQRHGGENHAFDHGGMHFVCLSSASPQEPVPSLDAKTRAWLRRDLARLPAHTPVVVALHHPPDSTEFATPAELETLLDLLRDHNVVLFLYGHGHGVHQREYGGIPGVMGGSTFGKNAGYGILQVTDGRMRYAYRYQQPPKEGAPEWQPVLDVKLRKQAPPRLFRIADVQERDGRLAVRLAAEAGAALADARVTYRVDGEERTPVSGAEQPGDAGAVVLDTSGLGAGAHLLTVVVELPRKRHGHDLRTHVFHVERPGVQVVWRKQLDAAIKAAPVVLGEQLLVAGNDGVLRAIAAGDGSERWTYQTGGEILGTPAAMRDVIVFGSGDGRVHGLSPAGERLWAFDAGQPVYGPPLIADGVAYVGDNGGRLHALRVQDGARKWVFERADFAIEAQPVLWQDLVVFGAWDGKLYAVAAADGTLRWKADGPRTSAGGGGARYYAPADCAPVVLGDFLYVCDRGYALGRYDAQGKLLDNWELKVAGISAARGGGALYGRATDDRVLKLGLDGKPLWEAARPAGRFPIPPTTAGAADTVLVCSNRGLLQALAAADGTVAWSYHVTPGFYVMAPVAASEGVCYAAGMDGSVVAVRGG